MSIKLMRYYMAIAFSSVYEEQSKPANKENIYILPYNRHQKVKYIAGINLREGKSSNRYKMKTGWLTDGVGQVKFIT